MADLSVEERASELHRKFSDPIHLYLCDGLSCPFLAAVTAAIRDSDRAAARRERERCAQVARDVADNEHLSARVGDLGREFGLTVIRTAEAIETAIRDGGVLAVGQGRERVIRIIKDVSYDSAEMCARQNGDEYSAEAGFEQARQVIYSAICALPDD